MKAKHISGTDKKFEEEVSEFLATMKRNQLVSIKYSTTPLDMMEEHGIAVEYSVVIVYFDR